jgi:hypothetical protein
VATVATSSVTFMNARSQVIHICGNVVAMLPNNRQLQDSTRHHQTKKDHKSLFLLMFLEV